MAWKARKKHHWLRALVLFVVTPLTIWMIAFVIWLFWYDIERLAIPAKTSTRPAGSASHDRKPGKTQDARPVQRSRENIPEEDRKQLDDILTGR